MNQSYYIFSAGELKRKDNSLAFLKSDGSKTDIPIERVYDLYIFGEMTYNTKLFNFLATKGVCVHLFNYYDFYTGSFYPREQRNSGKLLVQQVSFYTDEEKRLKLAKNFIEAGSYNIFRNMRYYHTREKCSGEALEKVSDLRNEINDATDIHMLMGIEGNIRKVYYETWTDIFSKDVEFEKRVKQPPDNMVNTLISFLNTMMYTKVLSEIYQTQLNPTISYLHEPGEKRFSLALDVAEVFKPLLVDRLIFSLINKGIISDSDFSKEENFLRMKEHTVQKIVQEFENELKRTIKHKKLNRTVSYNHLIRLELYKLIKHLINEKSYEGFKMWW
ncbi:type I-B CRISPR-associated endonuclease Cas1b [Eubacteriaceae bacterium ES3]|nr:type I-B CRISPR-associated endonuclease Cas1b [Eubacteriaceae bacterium ES3]